MMTMAKCAAAIAGLCVLTTFLPALAHAQPKPLGPPHFRDAEVYRDEIVVAFPRPNREIDAPTPALLGHYAWRFTIESSSKVSIALYTPTPVQSRDHEEVLRSAILRRCPSTTSTIEECTIPVKGRFKVNPASIRVEITDEAIVSTVRAARPQTFWRIVIEPGGHYEVDQLEIRYR